MLIATAAVCVSYLLGRDLFGSRAAGVVTASAMLAFHGFIQYASNGPREKTPMTLFVVRALWAVTRRRWFTAGSCTSLATLCLQTAFFSTFPAVVVGVLLLADRRPGACAGAVALGGLVPGGGARRLVRARGVAAGRVGRLLRHQPALHGAQPGRRELEPVRGDLQEAYGVSVWSAPRPAAVPAGAGPRRGVPPRPAAVPAWRCCRHDGRARAGCAWNLKDYDAWADLFPVLPFAAVGSARAFAVPHGLSRRLGGRGGVARPVGAVVVALRLRTRPATTPSTSSARRRTPCSRRCRRTPTITSIEAPQPLVLTGRTNPTRHQMFRSGLQDYLEDTWPGGRDGFERDLVAGRPGPDRRRRDASRAGGRRSSPTTSTSAGRRGGGGTPARRWGEETIAELRTAAGLRPGRPVRRAGGHPAMSRAHRLRRARAGSIVSGLPWPTCSSPWSPAGSAPRPPRRSRCCGPSGPSPAPPSPSRSSTGSRAASRPATRATSYAGRHACRARGGRCRRSRRTFWLARDDLFHRDDAWFPVMIVLHGVGPP